MATHLYVPVSDILDVRAGSSSSSAAPVLSQPLAYNIFSVSSSFPPYGPENILLNRPQDPNSRWSPRPQHYNTAEASQQPVQIHKPKKGAYGFQAPPAVGTTYNPAVRLAPISGGDDWGSSSTYSDDRKVATNDGAWLIIQLHQMSILRSVTLGKPSKPHPCTPKSFSLYAGLHPSHLKLVLSHQRVRSTTTDETWGVGWRNDFDGGAVPCRYVKIILHAAAQPNFNPSIWFLSLSGISDASIVQSSFEIYTEQREKSTNLLVLKYLRSTLQFGAFEALLSSPTSHVTSQQFEHPLLTKLHDAIVLRGAYDESEFILRQISVEGLFDAYTSQLQPKVKWECLIPSIPADEVSLLPPEKESVPGPRGGHQMVFDSKAAGGHGRLYMFGGWNGVRNLDDLWCWSNSPSAWSAAAGHEEVLFEEEDSVMDIEASPKTGQNRGDVTPHGSDGPGGYKKAKIGSMGRKSSTDAEDELQGRWTKLGPSLSESTSEKKTGAPSWPEGRSCHKLAVDEVGNGDLYLLGKYLDPRDQAEGISSSKSDFWIYEGAREGKGNWRLLSSDTAGDGGPELIYDCDMCIDKRHIYVFGGTKYSSVNDGAKPSNSSFTYSGMFKYSLDEGKWEKLFEHGKGDKGNIISRSGHCMVMDSQKRQIYIFGGLHNRTYLSDLWSFNLDTHQLTLITRDYAVPPHFGPSPAFTARACLDTESNEIVYLSGQVKETSGQQTVAKKELWTCSLDNECKWTRLDAAEGSGGPKQKQEEDSLDRWLGGRSGLGVDVCDEPIPRFGHQMILDQNSDTFYLFGGNPGTTDGTAGKSTDRLGDFWKLKIERPALHGFVERKTLLALRRERYLEMCETSDAMEALQYLQTKLHAVVDHDDEDESAMFRSLLAHLLSKSTRMASSSASYTKDSLLSIENSDVKLPSRQVHKQRLEVFQAICSFTSRDNREPEGNLVDLCDGIGRLSI